MKTGSEAQELPVLSIFAVHQALFADYSPLLFTNPVESHILPPHVYLCVCVYRR